MFSGLTNQVSNWMNKKQEDDAAKPSGDTSPKDEDISKNVDEKKEVR